MRSNWPNWNPIRKSTPPRNPSGLPVCRKCRSSSLSILRFTDYTENDLLSLAVYTGRGVQYARCVMHKCIMEKVGGNEIHVKYGKTRKFYKISGEILPN